MSISDFIEPLAIGFDVFEGKWFWIVAGILALLLIIYGLSHLTS